MSPDHDLSKDASADIRAFQVQSSNQFTKQFNVTDYNNYESTQEANFHKGRKSPGKFIPQANVTVMDGMMQGTRETEVKEVSDIGFNKYSLIEGSQYDN